MGMETQSDVQLDSNSNIHSSISESMKKCIQDSSWIRQMFEDGHRMKEEFGDENVFDFTLGNPNVPPPVELHERMVDVARQSCPEDHRYMRNAGMLETRRYVARRIREEQGVAVDESHVTMTCGAAGALNIFLKTTLDPGDEVVILSPYFPEYVFYIENHGGRCVIVGTDENFQPDVAAIESHLSPRTKVVIINTPNNPTGVVYDQASVDAVARLVERHSEATGRHVFLVLDEPYRRIRYIDTPHPSLLSSSPNGVLVGSWSKDLGLAGERIGYLVVHPDAPGAEELTTGFSIATRVLGFVNAPAFMQRLVRECDDLCVDIEIYRENRSLLHSSLTGMGYSMPDPNGAFFLFPKAPGGDDVAFINKLRSFNVLCVPGVGFGTPGYFRMSYAVERSVIERAMPLFERAISESPPS